MSDFLHDLCKAEARIAELEAVAEAVKQQYNTNPYVTIHMSVYEAMRAAGYFTETVQTPSSNDQNPSKY